MAGGTPILTSMTLMPQEIPGDTEVYTSLSWIGDLWTPTLEEDQGGVR